MKSPKLPKLRKAGAKEATPSAAKAKTKAKAKTAELSAKAPRRAKKSLRIAGLVIWPRFMRNSVKELKMVTWPSWKTSRGLTFAVLLFALVFAVAVYAVDQGLNEAFKKLFLK